MTEENPTRFYVVSMGKFSMLFFATVGLYSLYWLYQGFKTQQEIRQKELYPVLRTLVAIFFVHSLFGFVREQEQKKAGQEQRPWDPAYLAWVYIGVGVFQLVNAVISNEFSLGPLWGLFTMLVALVVQFYALYQVQLAINRLEGDPFGKSNSRMSFRNQLWIAFGAYIWASFIFGVYLEVTGQEHPTAVESQQTGDTPTLPAY